MHSSNTNYDRNFKIDVLKILNDSGVTANKAAYNFNIPSPSKVHKWVRLYNTIGMVAMKSKEKWHPPLKTKTRNKIILKHSD